MEDNDKSISQRRALLGRGCNPPPGFENISIDAQSEDYTADNAPTIGYRPGESKELPMTLCLGLVERAKQMVEEANEQEIEDLLAFNLNDMPLPTGLAVSLKERMKTADWVATNQSKVNADKNVDHDAETTSYANSYMDESDTNDIGINAYDAEARDEHLRDEAAGTMETAAAAADSTSSLNSLTHRCIDMSPPRYISPPLLPNITGNIFPFPPPRPSYMSGNSPPFTQRSSVPNLLSNDELFLLYQRKRVEAGFLERMVTDTQRSLNNVINVITTLRSPLNDPDVVSLFSVDNATISPHDLLPTASLSSFMHAASASVATQLNGTGFNINVPPPPLPTRLAFNSAGFNTVTSSSGSQLPLHLGQYRPMNPQQLILQTHPERGFFKPSNFAFQ